MRKIASVLPLQVVFVSTCIQSQLQKAVSLPNSCAQPAVTLPSECLWRSSPTRITTCRQLANISDAALRLTYIGSEKGLLNLNFWVPLRVIQFQTKPKTSDSNTEFGEITVVGTEYYKKCADPSVHLNISFFFSKRKSALMLSHTGTNWHSWGRNHKKAKGLCLLYHAGTKRYRSTAPYILNLTDRWRWIFNVTLGPLNTREKSPLSIQVEAGLAQIWPGPICMWENFFRPAFLLRYLRQLVQSLHRLCYDITAFVRICIEWVMKRLICINFVFCKFWKSILKSLIFHS